MRAPYASCCRAEGVDADVRPARRDALCARRSPRNLIRFVSPRVAAGAFAATNNCHRQRIHHTPQPPKQGATSGYVYFLNAKNIYILALTYGFAHEYLK